MVCNYMLFKLCRSTEWEIENTFRAYAQVIQRIQGVNKSTCFYINLKSDNVIFYFITGGNTLIAKIIIYALR